MSCFVERLNKINDNVPLAYILWSSSKQSIPGVSDKHIQAWIPASPGSPASAMDAPLVVTGLQGR